MHFQQNQFYALFNQLGNSTFFASLVSFCLFFILKVFLPSPFCSNSYCFNFEKFFFVRKKVFRWVVIDFHLVHNGVNSFLEYQFYVFVVFKKKVLSQLFSFVNSCAYDKCHVRNDFYPLCRRTELTIEEPNFGVNAYKKGVPRKPN